MAGGIRMGTLGEGETVDPYDFVSHWIDKVAALPITAWNGVELPSEFEDVVNEHGGEDVAVAYRWIDTDGVEHHVRAVFQVVA